jgi:hypothetical protein
MKYALIDVEMKPRFSHAAIPEDNCKQGIPQQPVTARDAAKSAAGFRLPG